MSATIIAVKTINIRQLTTEGPFQAISSPAIYNNAIESPWTDASSRAPIG